MKTASFKDHNAYTDAELINLLREDSAALSTVYYRHKDYCMNFMKSMYNEPEEIKDIYQDAVIVLYQNILRADFTLTCSIQTYLNSICRNQVLRRTNFAKRFQVQNNNGAMEFIESIADWHSDPENVNHERVNVLKNILQEMRSTSNKCYEILVRFFYRNQTMDKIADDLGYTNADNAKNQKYRCQEKLKAEAIKRLKNEL